MLYSEKVMDHFQHPRNLGKMDDADGIGEVGNAKCGDIMKMYIKVDDGIITDVKFNTFGCGSAIATSSMATEMIKGRSVEDALKLSNKAVVEALDGLPSHKIHCSVLAEEAVRAADRNTAKITRRTMSKPRMIPLNEKTMNQNENIGSSEGWKNAFMTKTVMKNALNRFMLLSVFIKLSFPILYTMRITANETM